MKVLIILIKNLLKIKVKIIRVLKIINKKKIIKDLLFIKLNYNINYINIFSFIINLNKSSKYLSIISSLLSSTSWKILLANWS